MNKLFLFAAMTLIAAGCSSDGGTGPKCTTPQEMLRCDKVLNIAHRGGRSIRPEQTLLADDQALRDGTDILELDVNETRDGVLVVMHDKTVDRTGQSFEPIDPEYDPPGEFLQVPPERGGILVLHDGFISRAHELDMDVHAWTINDEQEMRHLIEMGIDGIMTHDPPLLARVIDELGDGD